MDRSGVNCQNLFPRAEEKGKKLNMQLLFRDTRCGTEIAKYYDWKRQVVKMETTYNGCLHFTARLTAHQVFRAARSFATVMTCDGLKFSWGQYGPKDLDKSIMTSFIR